MVLIESIDVKDDDVGVAEQRRHEKKQSDGALLPARQPVLGLALLATVAAVPGLSHRRTRSVPGNVLIAIELFFSLIDFSSNVFLSFDLKVLFTFDIFMSCRESHYLNFIIGDELVFSHL